MQTDTKRGVCESALELHWYQKGSGRKCQGQNRTREIRPSGIAGGLAETWAMVKAVYGRGAETSKSHADT
jgi:hypothetical protein